MKMYSNEIIEDGSEWTPKYRKTETEVARCYKKGEMSKHRRSTIPENAEIENSTNRPRIGKSTKKEIYTPLRWMSSSQDSHGRGNLTPSPN